MSTDQITGEILQQIKAGYGLFALNTFEEKRWEQALTQLATRLSYRLETWSVATSARDELLTRLNHLATGEQTHCLLLLKDIHSQLTDPQVIRALREAEQSGFQNSNCLLLMGPSLKVPIELEKNSLSIDLPLPDHDDLKKLCQETIDASVSQNKKLSAEGFDRLVQTLLGLTLSQAQRTLTKALQATAGKINEACILSLVSDKQKLLQDSDLLEYYDLSTNMDSVGGLETLKGWLGQRSSAFSETTRKQGVPAPKGVLILGIQGCGKSLTARAVAHLLKFPLLRMDISTLLTSDRGASERNMRMALQAAETMSPSVLWIDELDKGFAGASLESGNDTTLSRLLGRFLTWMEEQQGKVFVVATANSIEQLPPETIRRGRFDELFFVDLPNYYERTEIFQIHLTKRNVDPAEFDLDELVEKTEGYSGAEIEQIVSATVLECFSEKRPVSQKEILNTVGKIVPLSVTMEEKIFELREWAKDRCRQATPDSRVLQMLDHEKRHGQLQEEPSSATAQRDWKRLIEQENFSAAITEYVRVNDQCTIEDLQTAFKPYFETRGEHGLVLRKNPKVMIGVRLSDELNVLLSQLISGRRVYLHISSPETYKRKLPIPNLEAVPPEKLKEFSWLPVCFRNIPSVTDSQDLSKVGRIRKSSATTTSAEV